MFDRVKIRRVGGLIGGVYSIIFELFLDFISCVDRGIVLHEIEVVCVVAREHCVEYFDIRGRGVPLLLRLEVTVYYIELRPLSMTPKHRPDYDSKVFSLLVGFDELRLLFIRRRTPYPRPLLSFTPLRRTLVTPHILSPLFDGPILPRETPSKPKSGYFSCKLRSFLCAPMV